MVTLAVILNIPILWVKKLRQGDVQRNFPSSGFKQTHPNYIILYLRLDKIKTVSISLVVRVVMERG